MSSSYTDIEIEDYTSPPIVKLFPNPASEATPFDMIEGWVNVGPYSVFISMNPGVMCRAEIHPRGNEAGTGLTSCQLSERRCREEGGEDPDLFEED